VTAELTAGLIPEHLGKLHGYEHAIVLLLAFGPILLLAVTVYIARKRIDDEDEGLD
jgi:hypothetical protein